VDLKTNWNWTNKSYWTARIPPLPSCYTHTYTHKYTKNNVRNRSVLYPPPSLLAVGWG